ncbi:hypothetical protein [Silvimonas soli]|uniref:hypothetical protein n=1 Tax=Silvimonas soli TaxID=2980100 RepID=UPI0024B34E6E|nr:hypothetical protein [Silvimonas soli]
MAVKTEYIFSTTNPANRGKVVVVRYAEYADVVIRTAGQSNAGDLDGFRAIGVTNHSHNFSNEELAKIAITQAIHGGYLQQDPELPSGYSVLNTEISSASDIYLELSDQ